MKKALFALVFAVAGCSSSDPAPMGTDDASDAMARDSATSDGGADTGTETGADGGADAGGKDAGEDAAMSADCKTYCDCFEANCASIQTIPNGMSCGAFCATFTKDQWTCRNAHCQLVVPEKNPYHCQHAVGIDQCM